MPVKSYNFSTNCTGCFAGWTCDPLSEMEEGTFPTWMIISTDILMKLMDTIYKKGHIFVFSVGVGTNNIIFCNAKP